MTTTTTTPALYPKNDFGAEIQLWTVDAATAKVIPLTTGTVTAFLATSNLPTATAADPSLSVTATHIRKGIWLIRFDASLLTAALLASLFATATPYLIVEQTDGVRTVVTMAYTPTRPADVTDTL